MDNNNNIFRKHKLDKALKASLPLFALLGGNAVASNRFSSGSASRRLPVTSVVHVDSQGAKLKGGKKADVITGNKASAFGTFSKRQNKPVQQAKIKVDNSALAFLQSNDLLQPGGEALSSLSGNTLSDRGNKTFSALGPGYCGVITAHQRLHDNKTDCVGDGKIWQYTSNGQCSQNPGVYTNAKQCLLSSYAWNNANIVSTFGGADTTPPSFENSTPSIGAITGTGATVSADLDEEGSVYYVVVADGAAAPSAAEVKAGTGSGGSGQLASGNFATSSTTGSEAFSGLSDNTSYDIYVVAEDGVPNLQASATKVDFTTTDVTEPTITSVSIPDNDHKNGDIVTATITVASDTDDYTTGIGGINGSGGSGNATINGYTLGSLTKVNNSTYTATFTVGTGTDVAAGSDIAVSFSLDDSSGNTSADFTTAISQASDAIYANLPVVDLSADINTVAEDGGVSTLTATLSGSLNNQWPSAITVNLAYTGTGTAGTDYSKSDSIVISAGSSSNTATVTGIADTLFDAATDETAIVDISSVSEGNENGVQQETITITDAETAPTVDLTVGNASVNENGGTSTITATLSHQTYDSTVVNLSYGGTAVGGDRKSVV